jgi:hypothetical protein
MDDVVYINWLCVCFFLKIKDMYAEKTEKTRGMQKKNRNRDQENIYVSHGIKKKEEGGGGERERTKTT